MAPTLSAVPRRRLGCVAAAAVACALLLAVPRSGAAAAAGAPADLEAQLAELDQEQFDLSREVEQAQLEAREAERVWLAAQDRLAATTLPEATDMERVAATRLSLQVAQRRLAMLQRRLEAVDPSRHDVALWHELLDGEPARKVLRAAVPDLEQRAAELRRQIAGEASRLPQLQSRRDALAARLEGLAQGTPLAGLASRQIADIDELIRLNRDDLEQLERHAAIPSRLLQEIRSRTGGESTGDRLERLATSLRGLWNYELVEVEDSPITLGKTLMALALLIVGFLLSKLVATVLGRRVFPRMGMDDGGSAAFQTLIFYLSLTAFFLWSLRVVHIPLTVFTVLGGALAIGVGFGSQNIVNNFISGLILLTERPIKVGDLIEVDGTYGEVERIGPRSTRIRAGDNTHVIVPNSWFLENSVHNWTLADNQLRAFVDVGVAYGSDTARVSQLLLHAAGEHPQVLGEPGPEVLFREFGDNALLLETYFWIQANTVMDRKRIESSVRLRIDTLFRDAGISIAFPQRDVHLDAGVPLPVRVVDETEPGVSR
jgi:potassium-dependent mechanosensitive channel